MNRRDFLIGTAAGVTAATTINLVGKRMGGGPPAPAPKPSAPITAVPAAAPVPETEPLYKGRLSFAQQGEDLITYNLLRHEFGIESPTYLDIGAGDPVLSNNTYALYGTGSRGVLVEPNPTLIERLKRVRPGDVVINAGVGLKDTTAADYYVIKDQWPLNTFSLEDVAELRRTSKTDPVERVIKMPLIQINELIAAHFTGAPDLLSIDIEGMDLAVLRTLDFKKHRPAVICAETKKPRESHDGTAIARFLKGKGYVACAGSLYNTIFGDSGRFRT
jgi:FkbM family methyltransferase